MEGGRASSPAGPRAEVGEPLDEWEPVGSSPEDVISEFEERSDDSVGLSGGGNTDSSPTKSPSGDARFVSESSGQRSATTTASDGDGDGETTAPQAEATAEEGQVPPAVQPLDTQPESSTLQESPGELSEVSMSPLQPPVGMDSPSAPPAIDAGGMSREHIEPTNEPIVESPKARNWGWGWGAVSGALKEVSAGVAKDVQELKASFQAAIQVDSEEEQEDAAGGEEAEEEDPSAPKDTAGAPQEPTAEELRRQEVLARLEGEDTEIEKGLKVLDDHVEQLANGLWGLVGKAGRGVGTLARQVEAVTKEAASGVAQEFQETLEDVRSLHAVQLASTGIAAAAKSTGKRLVQTAENMGRTAVSILESAWEEDLHDVALDADATFDELFRAAGGHAALEETEELGNECARLFNRGRRSLEEGQRDELDKLAAAFAPLFDLAVKLVDSSEGGKGIVPLVEEYAAVESVRIQAVEHALQLSSAASQLAKDQLSPMDLSTCSEGGAVSESELRTEQRTRATMAIGSLKREAVQCMAQVTAASVNHLLKLGMSVGAPLLGDDSPGFNWPSSPSDKATLLRFCVQQLDDDVNTVSAAFCEALAEAEETLLAPISAGMAAAAGQTRAKQEEDGDEEEEGGRPSQVVALRKDTATAVQWLRDAFRALMYVLLATKLHESGAVESTPAARGRVKPEEEDEEDEDDEDYITWADGGDDGDDDEDEDEDEQEAEEEATVKP